MDVCLRVVAGFAYLKFRALTLTGLTNPVTVFNVIITVLASFDTWLGLFVLLDLVKLEK